MYSFYSEDLHETIYVPTETEQPFWASSNSFNPMESAIPIDILASHQSELIAAHNNHLNWDSGVIKLGYIVDSNQTILVKAEYYSSTDKLKIFFGYINSIGSTPPVNPNNWAYNTSGGEVLFSDYIANPKLGCIYCYQAKYRDLFDTPPAYTGEEAFKILPYQMHIYAGTEYPPAPPTYPEGTWQYVYRRLGNIEEVPLCVPCQANGETVHDCNVIVGLEWSASTISKSTPFYVSDADGNYNTDPDEPVPDEPFTPADPDPYIPDPDDTSDTIAIPDIPDIGVTKAGFINVYNPSINALQGLGDILFPNVASATDIVDAVLKLCETLANQNLINYVIDCHVIPVKPQVGASTSIKVGFNNTSIMVPAVTSDYIDVSCGALNIREYFGGFQDFQLTRSKIYLPFIGFVDTLPEYWVAGTIKIDYRFNVIDGSFMAFIRSKSARSNLNDSVIAQYAGNACMHFPITGANYAAMASGLIGAAVAGASSGTATGALGAAYSAANVIVSGPSIQQSNGYNSTAALLGVRTPFLLIERPVPSYAGKYSHDKGYPSNISTLLSAVTGFTIIDDIDLSGIPLTQEELEELRGLLKEGVYF